MKLILPTTHQGTGEGVTRDFNQIEVVDAGFEARAKKEMTMANAIGAVLVKKYNNREWKVIVDIEGGLLIIGCDSISNEKGYHIHIAGRTIQQLEQRALFAAGEILERHNLARSKGYNIDKFETLARDAHDNVITLDSAAEPI